MPRHTLTAVLLIAIVAAFAQLDDRGPLSWHDRAGDAAARHGGTPAIAAAFRAQRSDVQVEGHGIVERVLRDDLDGSRHQRFILRLDNGQTLLVAHNIDLAPRIPGLRRGDRVAFYGEYEWNSQGGVIHWTHHDPAGRHVDGWLRHNGRTYR